MVRTESVEQAGLEGRRRKAMTAVAGALLLNAMPAGAGTCAVSPELWDRPRSGAAISANASLLPCIQEMIDSSASSMLIRYAAGSDLQAEELRAWLISLALDPRRITLVPDAALRDGMAIEVGARR